ncbi:glutathione S-transferase 1-like [Harmonia axyridis]|uniref:glutathione S-transferase 1-like n=1 Tax=Harmonia axyridis TaxID=115357 RepID=UPI001E278A05|nr:glutathione S-transferase 1-like [Harmonia axyridis]
MTPKLYMNEVSPAVRAVLMTAKALNITLDLKEVNFQEGEHLSPKYLKLNPQHTIPTLDDKGLIIWDSHAIIAYLVGKYGEHDSFYPKDIEKRAVVDQRLHFDSGLISHILKEIMNPIIYGASMDTSHDFYEKTIRIYDLVETFLVDSWIAGNYLSIADFSLIASISTLNIIIPIDPLKYTRIVRWLHRSEKETFYDANRKGLDKIRNCIQYDYVQVQDRICKV